MTSTDRTVVIGIDPSLTGTGLALPGPVPVTTIRSHGHDTDTLRMKAVRFNALADAILDSVQIAAGGERLLVVIERPIPTAGGKSQERAGLYWRLVTALFRMTNVEVVDASPSQRMKYATGKGSADKDVVLAAVIRRYPDFPVSNNNEADALVLRAMGEHALGRPIVPVPKAHADALHKVAWPGYIDIEGVLA